MAQASVTSQKKVIDSKNEDDSVLKCESDVKKLKKSIENNFEIDSGNGDVFEEYLPLINCIASQDTVDESHRLYEFHFRREFMINGLLIPEYILREGFPLNFSSIITLADRFRASPQRQWVYEQAQRVDLESLNFHAFQDLLNGLFQEGGVTWERVLVLFFFCTDLATRTFREKLSNYFVCINEWTCNYIGNTLSNWIEDNGGWEEVLREPMSPLRKFALLSACCIGVIAIVFYIKKWKTV